MVRPINLSAVSYSPEQPPTNQDEFNRYVYNELLKIQQSISALAAGHIDKTYVSPTKPRDGDIRYADGTSWNPGSGAGVYYFNGTIWKLLG